MRSEQVAKNVLANSLVQVVYIVLGFINRTVFIYTLSAAYLGVSGLFSSILSVLNLAELGVTSSIMYALYAPLSKKNDAEVLSVMEYYRKAYRIIGLVILVAGLALLPFLHYFVSGDTDLVNIRIAFLLYLAYTVASYWAQAYKNILLDASQQKYVSTSIICIVNVVTTVARIFILILLRGAPVFAYYVYVAADVVGQIAKNVAMAKVVDKKFPFMKRGGQKPEPLSREKWVAIRKNVVGTFSNKVSAIMLTSADNILLSAFIGLTTVGLYSNYIALKSYVVKVVSIVFDSMTASVGDFCASEPLDKQMEFFKALNLAYFWVYGFCSICLWNLLNPFIGNIWLGREFLLSNLAVFLIVLNFLLDGLAGGIIAFRTAHGLYWQAKFRYIFSALFNVVISILLVKPMGVEGVLLGSTVSVLIMLSFDPVIVFKNVFHQSALRYYLGYLGYLLLVIGTGAVVGALSALFSEPTILHFVIKVVISVVVPNALWYLIFRKSKNMHLLSAYFQRTMKFLAFWKRKKVV